MKIDGRGRHGNQGRKKIKDPRNKPVNIRLNEKEKADFDSTCKYLGLSQADCLVYLNASLRIF